MSSTSWKLLAKVALMPETPEQGFDTPSVKVRTVPPFALAAILGGGELGDDEAPRTWLRETRANWTIRTSPRIPRTSRRVDGLIV
jgi:hypothetical protein